MKKKGILSAILILIIFSLLSLVVFGSKNKKNNQNNSRDNSFKNASLVLYYGNTCPHCRELEEWLAKNKIDQKLKIEKREVYQNKENAQKMLEAAKTCQIESKNLGVPFLFAKNKCFLGTEEIIKYLKSYL